MTHCHAAIPCKRELSDKCHESLTEGGGDFPARAVAVQLLGKTTPDGWCSCPLQLRLSLPPQADACGAGARCLAEGYAAAGQGCKAPRAAGMDMWPQTQSALAVPLCCVKTFCCS